MKKFWELWYTILELLLLIGAFTSTILLDDFIKGTFLIALCIYVRLLRKEEESVK